MVARPRSLPLMLLLAACGDDGTGGTSAATSATTLTTAGTTTSATTDPGTAQSSGEPTTAPGTAATTSDDPSTTGTTSTTTTTTGDPETTGTSSSSTTAVDTTTTTTTDTTGSPAVCGDGVVDPGETCDDGSGVGCDTYHDGGDGACVSPGTCSPGYVLTDSNECVPELWADHVHIYVDNTCKMKVEPTSFAVAPGQKLRLDYHNHSADYPVDVWMHYNGGYTDLQPGATWMEQYEHCFGPNPSEGWAEISTACSQVILPIKCL
jgi:hypothetical protein